MPYEWVDNDVALKHEGVTVYHVCKNDWACDGHRSYWFSMEAGGSEEGSFDVRSLNELMENPIAESGNGDFAKEVLKAAIDQGILKDEMEDDDVYLLIEEKKA